MRTFRSKGLGLLLALLLALTGLGNSVSAAGGVSLFTPYVSITVAPGEQVSYDVDVINDSAAIQTLDLAVSGLPDGWTTDLTAGGRKIDRIAVKPGATETVTLDVTVPAKVDKGTYRFAVDAGSAGSLPLSVTVSETGTYTAELETKQPNLQGSSGSDFTFTTTLHNKTAAKQMFALQADAPAGWAADFTVNSKKVTSTEVDAGGSQDITVTAHPPDKVKAGTYKISVTATAGSLTAKTELEAVVTGTYVLDLSSASGNLNADITAGGDKKVTLKVTNTGTADMSDINLNATTPSGWSVTFNPTKLNALPAGQSTQVAATIHADKKAIAGDYMLTMTAAGSEKSSDAQFRMTVHTSVVWGWIGVLIILAVIAGVYSLFRKYGRR